MGTAEKKIRLPLHRAYSSNSSHFSTVGLGARDFSLSLSFPICKMGLTGVPTSQVSFEVISTRSQSLHFFDVQMTVSTCSMLY